MMPTPERDFHRAKVVFDSDPAGASASTEEKPKTALERWQKLRSDIPEVLQAIADSHSPEEIVKLLEEAAKKYKGKFSSEEKNTIPETPAVQRVRIFLEAAHFAAEWGDLKNADLAMYLSTEAVARLNEHPMKAAELNQAFLRTIQTARGVGLSTPEGEDLFSGIMGLQIP